MNLAWDPGHPWVLYRQPTASSRWQELTTSLDILRHHWLLGCGLGTNPALYDGVPMRAHFTLLNIAATTGVPSLLAFLGILAAVWRRRTWSGTYLCGAGWPGWRSTRSRPTSSTSAIYGCFWACWRAGRARADGRDGRKVRGKLRGWWRNRHPLTFRFEESSQSVLLRVTQWTQAGKELVLSSIPGGDRLVPKTAVMLKSTDRKPGEWTADDLAQLPENDGKCYEIIDGVLFVTPAPFEPHQRAVGAIFAKTWTYCDERKCGLVYVAPFDVHLTFKSVVEPDIIYIANDRLEILQDWVEGAPTLVVEVLSSKPALDRVHKLRLYAEQGIPHYWMVDPTAHTLEVLELEGTSYRVAWVGEGEAQFSPSLFPGLTIPLAQLWADPRRRPSTRKPRSKRT